MTLDFFLIKIIFKVFLANFLIINQTTCYNEATGPDKHEKFNTTNTYYDNKRKILITFIFGNGSKCGGMCFICFIWVIKQELLPTRHINLLTNNYIQCFFLRKKCKPMGNIFYRNIGFILHTLCFLCLQCSVSSTQHCCTAG